MGPEENWKRLIEIYNHSKALHMLAEEIDPEHETFVAPLIQHRDTLDHILRAKAGELKMLPDTDDEHANRNLDKALGHAYRAFFDVADWLGVLLREKALAPLNGRTTECIQAVMPEYFTSWRRTLDDAAERLVEVRSAKDVGDGGALIQEVDRYVVILDEMHRIVKEIRAREGAASDWISRDGQKSKLQKRTDWTIAIAAGLLCVAVGAVAGVLLPKFFP